MDGQWDVLVASSQLEHRKTLIRILDGLSLNVISSSNVKQAEEALRRHAISLVFCDDQLPDGSYRDLLAARVIGQKPPRVVVTTRTGEWQDYLEAMRHGAFDVVRAPVLSTDVELVVLRAIHEEEQRSAYRKTA